MAQKKISKKDLEQRVAKLKKKVATVTTRLSQQQSGLSRTLSSVQKQLNGLLQDDGLGAELAAQGIRQNELAQTTEGLLARLQDLEHTTSLAERAGNELRTRTEALETRAAEAVGQYEELLARAIRLEDRTQVLGLLQERLENLQSDLQLLRGAGGLDSGVERSVAALRDRTQAVEEHLGRLSDAQESLGLQVALLSREAEEAAAPPQAVSAPVRDDPQWAQRANELAAQIQQMHDSVVKETHDAADLADRSQQLEISASELLKAQQTLQARVDQLEHLAAELQQGMASGEPPELARLIPGLVAQCGMAEETAGKLNRRAAVLEAGQESLAIQDAELVKQLQAVEHRLSELADETGRLASEKAALAGVPEALRQQISLLNADQAVNHSRLEEVFNRTDALEKSAVHHRELGDALSDRFKTLSEEMQGLLALSADRRLDELDLRGGALEQSLQEQYARISELQQSGGKLDQQLSLVIDAAEALESRLDTLDIGSERFNSEFVRLDDAIQNAARNAQQQQELLHTHDARFATMDDSRQVLQERNDALGVQQARQDHETQNLQQRLRKRTVVGLLMLLLTAGALGFLLFRAPAVPEGMQLALQAGASADSDAASAIAVLQKDMIEVRREQSVFGDSLAQLVHSVDEINATAVRGFPVQLNSLTKTVETLTRQNLQQRQVSAGLQKGQEQQQQERAKLQEVQEQLQAELDRIADELRVIGEKGRQAPVLTATARTADGKRWAQARKSGSYTLQLAGFHRRESLEWFLKRQRIGPDSAVYYSEYEGQKWYVLFLGIYENIEQAVAATRQLPPSLAAQRPWVRRIPKTGELLPL